MGLRSEVLEIAEMLATLDHFRDNSKLWALRERLRKEDSAEGWTVDAVRNYVAASLEETRKSLDQAVASLAVVSRQRDEALKCIQDLQDASKASAWEMRARRILTDMVTPDYSQVGSLDKLTAALRDAAAEEAEAEALKEMEEQEGRERAEAEVRRGQRPGWEETIEGVVRVLGPRIEGWVGLAEAGGMMGDLKEILKGRGVLEDGYALAREFEELGYEPDAALVELLEGVEVEAYRVHDEQVRGWVVREGKCPELKEGDRVEMYGGKRGVIIEVEAGMYRYCVQIDGAGPVGKGKVGVQGLLVSCESVKASAG